MNILGSLLKWPLSFSVEKFHTELCTTRGFRCFLPSSSSPETLNCLLIWDLNSYVDTFKLGLEVLEFMFPNSSSLLFTMVDTCQDSREYRTLHTTLKHIYTIFVSYTIFIWQILIYKLLTVFYNVTTILFSDRYLITQHKICSLKLFWKEKRSSQLILTFREPGIMLRKEVCRHMDVQ